MLGVLRSTMYVVYQLSSKAKLDQHNVIQKLGSRQYNIFVVSKDMIFPTSITDHDFGNESHKIIQNNNTKTITDIVRSIYRFGFHNSAPIHRETA